MCKLQQCVKACRYKQIASVHCHPRKVTTPILKLVRLVPRLCRIYDAFDERKVLLSGGLVGLVPLQVQWRVNQEVVQRVKDARNRQHKNVNFARRGPNLAFDFEQQEPSLLFW